MIEKIRNMIEDATGMDVTRNQILMGLAVIVTLLAMVAILFLQSGGPKKDPEGMQVPLPDHSQTYFQK